MREWKTAKLTECCQSIADGDHQPPPKADTGIPFVTIANINSSNQLDFDNTLHVPHEYYEKLDPKRKARKDDILYSVVGSFGIPVFIKENKEFVFQRHIAILRPDPSVLFPRFLYYTMLTKDFYAQADAAAIGAAQRTISLNSLRNMIVLLPPIDTQKKIAEALSVYDDLIENNQRQIKLLEEAAQRLYKEWFVDLRYPGHENVPVVDGVPEGWKHGNLSEIAIFKRGTTITKATICKGVIPVVAGGLEPAYYHNISNAKAPVITVSGSGANAGYTRLYHVNIFASDCSFVDSIATPYIYYTYCFLKDNSSSLYKLQKGSAQPHVYAKDINALELIKPPTKLLIKYCNFVKSMFEKRQYMKSK